MKRFQLRPWIGAVFALAAIGVRAEEVSPPIPVIAAPASTALPAMNFYASVAGDELFAAVKENAAFVNLDKELLGSPIMLRVTHSLQPTTAGKTTGLLSGILAGSTLGLLPMVTNNTLVVTYEVLVHGQDVTTYSYQRSFTRAVNMWAKDDATHGLGKDGLEWIKGTAAEFATSATHDEKLAALVGDYNLYFGTAVPSPVAVPTAVLVPTPAAVPAPASKSR